MKEEAISASASFFQTASCARQIKVGLNFFNQAEIGQFDLPSRRQKHVVRLYVAVDNALRVSSGQGGGQLDPQTEDSF